MEYCHTKFGLNFWRSDNSFDNSCVAESFSKKQRPINITVRIYKFTNIDVYKTVYIREKLRAKNDQQKTDKLLKLLKINQFRSYRSYVEFI